MITKPKPGFLINPLHPLSQGLVGWWLFNEGGGPTAFDYSGKGNHGTLTNMDLTTAWVGSNSGGALQFDGSDDNVTINSLDYNFNVPNSFTISSWFNSVDTGNRNDIITNRTIAKGYGIQIDSISGLDRLNCFVEGDGGVVLSNRSTSSVIDGNWHFGVGVFDLSVSETRIYVDGVFENSVDISAITDISNTNTLRIGENINFDGRISEIRVWNRALLPIEIQQLFTNPYANVLNPQTTFSNNLFASAVALNIGGIGSGLSNFGHILRRRRRMHG